MHGFYARLRDKRTDDAELQDCIERVVNQLEDGSTSAHNPGMLLGKIQSGKTRGFLGVMARAFDRDYDIALVFTKGTKTLAKQTVRRISSDFKEFIDDEEVSVYDIMEMPKKLTRSELRRKIIIIAKKEANNLRHVITLFKTTYPELSSKRVLLIDDEADLASVRFVKKKDATDYVQGSIAQQMDDLRHLVPRIAFLQVTATPYALYLQPESYDEAPDKFVFLPKKPAFTELLPIHGGYVGGDDYFGDFSDDDPRHYLYVPVPMHEQDALRSLDGRSVRADRIFTSTNIETLRRALMTFLVAVVARRYQQAEQEQRPGKYAMIIHNDVKKAAHKWQLEIVERICAAFEEASDASGNDALIRPIFDEAYKDIAASVAANHGILPTADETFSKVKELILDGEINVQEVNSDVHLVPLLDADTAELKLRAQANIFIGGSILDRGITIPKLISFYYGRNPKRMQADTVLQHSRMYGARDRQDLAVTRFYTSDAVYDRLEQIHSLETALREAFESGVNDGGVVFIQNDASMGIIPCAPSKIARSETVTVRPSSFYLPTGFDTTPGEKASKNLSELEKILLGQNQLTKKFSMISLESALNIIGLIKPTLSIEESSSFQWNAMSGLIRYYCENSSSKEILLLVETNRKLNRANSGDKSGLSIIGGHEIRSAVRDNARSEPALILLQQAGTKSLGWKADMPFWWPVLAAPTDSIPCVFANALPAK